jgi:zinc protease
MRACLPRYRDRSLESLKVVTVKAARLLFILLILSLPGIAVAAVEEFSLDNGLKVLFIEDHKVPIANFQIWYRVGAIDEPAGKSGISHFLEHMMFKGTPRFGSKVFSNLIQKKGGTDNAFTTKDYTMYFQKLPPEAIGLSIEMEADRMKNLLLRPADVEAERAVVMEERRMRYEDQPQNLFYEDVIAGALRVQAYRKPVIGWMEEVAGLSREDLAEYYGIYYSPDNAFIIISGDVKPAELMPLIRKWFGPIPPAGSALKRVRTVEPAQQGERVVNFESETARVASVLMAYHVPRFPDKDSSALELLSSILSGGKSTRLFRSLVYEKRIALNVNADYEGLNRDPFIFTLSATVAPGKDIKAVEKALNDEIEKIAFAPPSAEELQKAKNQTEASFIFARDSSYAEALYTGMFEIAGGWRLKDNYLEGIRNVTAEEISAAARKYLVRQNRTVGYLIPKKAEKPGE